MADEASEVLGYVQVKQLYWTLWPWESCLKSLCRATGLSSRLRCVSLVHVDSAATSCSSTFNHMWLCVCVCDSCFERHAWAVFV